MVGGGGGDFFVFLVNIFVLLVNLFFVLNLCKHINNKRIKTNCKKKMEKKKFFTINNRVSCTQSILNYIPYG